MLTYSSHHKAREESSEDFIVPLQGETSRAVLHPAPTPNLRTGYHSRTAAPVSLLGAAPRVRWGELGWALPTLALSQPGKLPNGKATD